MEAKDYVTLTLSVVALGVSFFNLWWSTFRRRIALYFVSTDSWRYALVNGGKTDILLLSVRYVFVGTASDTAVFIKQDTGVNEGNPVLLQAGTALEHGVTWKSSLVKPFDYGRPVNGDSFRREMDALIEIGWLDNDGSARHVLVPTGTFTFDRINIVSHISSVSGKKVDLTKLPQRELRGLCAFISAG